MLRKRINANRRQRPNVRVLAINGTAHDVAVAHLIGVTMVVVPSRALTLGMVADSSLYAILAKPSEDAHILSPELLNAVARKSAHGNVVMSGFMLGGKRPAPGGGLTTADKMLQNVLVSLINGGTARPGLAISYNNELLFETFRVRTKNAGLASERNDSTEVTISGEIKLTSAGVTSRLATFPNNIAADLFGDGSLWDSPPHLRGKTVKYGQVSIATMTMNGPCEKDFCVPVMCTMCAF